MKQIPYIDEVHNAELGKRISMLFNQRQLLANCNLLQAAIDDAANKLALKNLRKGKEDNYVPGREDRKAEMKKVKRSIKPAAIAKNVNFNTITLDSVEISEHDELAKHTLKAREEQRQVFAEVFALVREDVRKIMEIRDTLSHNERTLLSCAQLGASAPSAGYVSKETYEAAFKKTTETFLAKQAEGVDRSTKFSNRVKKAVADLLGLTQQFKHLDDNNDSTVIKALSGGVVRDFADIAVTNFASARQPSLAEAVFPDKTQSAGRGCIKPLSAFFASSVPASTGSASAASASMFNQPDAAAAASGGASPVGSANASPAGSPNSGRRT